MSSLTVLSSTRVTLTSEPFSTREAISWETLSFALTTIPASLRAWWSVGLSVVIVRFWPSTFTVNVTRAMAWADLDLTASVPGVRVCASAVPGCTSMADATAPTPEAAATTAATAARERRNRAKRPRLEATTSSGTSPRSSTASPMYTGMASDVSSVVRRG